jgi:transcriptional regulator with XRE-family HTH domain
MRECQAARRIGVSVREYRELEAGTRSPTFETWDRIYELYGLAADVRGRDVSLRAP